MRDRIVDAIASGEKRSTSSLLREYESADEPLPQPGDRAAVVDSQGHRVFAIEIEAVVLTRLGDVPLAHAVAEGEGYSSVGEWRAAHERFWSSDGMRAELGEGFVLDDDAVVVMERFTLVD